MSVPTEMVCAWCGHKVPLLVEEELEIGEKGHFMCIKCQRVSFWMFTGERIATLTAVVIQTPDGG